MARRRDSDGWVWWLAGGLVAWGLLRPRPSSAGGSMPNLGVAPAPRIPPAPSRVPQQRPGSAATEEARGGILSEEGGEATALTGPRAGESSTTGGYRVTVPR